MASSLKELSADSDVNELWPLYKNEHNKSYDENEDKERFELFKATVQQIITHNEKFAKGEVTFTMGLNHFADLKPDERKFGGGVLKP